MHGGGDCSGGFCDIGGFDASHSHAPHFDTGSFDIGHGHTAHSNAGMSHSSHSDFSYIPVCSDSTSCSPKSKATKASFGNGMLRVAAIGVGAIASFDAWRRLTQPKTEENGTSSSWVGMIEAAGGVGLMAYGLLR